MTMNGEYARPDPEALLRVAVAEEARHGRGRLKIFFGASAGVGKTYAMLKNARQLREQGVDVVLGLVETHGRRETMELVEGLELLPRREIAHKGHNLAEFDVDAALARRPAVLLVDEYAHTNAPGSRHPKRWQDIEELLGEGIDVHTTLNVQHLESLNDLVGGITGIQVRETVPDRVFEAADEIVLVDLPADDLLQRLREGKVYMGEQAERAIKNFFRKGNLIALRELALRRTADRVNDAAHAFHRETGKERIWHTRERLLACVSASPGSEAVLRSAARLAAGLNAEWHTVYIETPAQRQESECARAAVGQRLKLAQDLGSTPATVSGVDVARTLVDYARKHEITKIVLGRTWQGWNALRLRGDLPRRVQRLAPEIEVLLVAQEEPEAPPARNTRERGAPLRRSQRRMHGALAAVGSAGLISGAMYPLYNYVHQTNIAMVYLLGVAVVSVRFGRSPAVLAALLNVACFDVLFVPPRYSFAVSDAQYVLTFAVMLGVGLLIAQLNRGLRFQAEMAGEREERVQQLYHVARALSGALTIEQVSDIAARGARALFQTGAAVLVPNLEDRLQSPPEEAMEGGPAFDLGVAQWAFDRVTPAGIGTDTLPGSKAYYLPLKAPMRTRGVLVLGVESAMQPEDLRHVETLGALVAIALERVHFVSVAQDTLVKIESERLRESLLATLSHDLRTPLTSLHGMTETLAQRVEAFPPDLRETVVAMQRQTEGMVRLVANLLAMARLESGKTPLRLDWVALEEIVGSAAHALREALKEHRFAAHIPPTFPLLFGDAVLLERVLVNLLENATKYVPKGKGISVEAREEEDAAVIEVRDEGPGLPPGREEEIFDKFLRGRPESSIPGVGLGLAICKAIVQAHHGTISARNRAEGGAAFIIRLPLRPAPPLELEPEAPGPDSTEAP